MHLEEEKQVRKISRTLVHHFSIHDEFPLRYLQCLEMVLGNSPRYIWSFETNLIQGIRYKDAFFLMEKISFQSIEGKGDDDRSNGDSFDKNGCGVGRLDDEELDWTRSKIFLFTWRV